MTQRELFRAGAILATAWGAVMTLTSCGSPEVDRQVPKLQQMISETLTSSSATVCLDNYAPADVYGPTYRDVLVGSVAQAQKELTSDRLDIRAKAKHALTWQFVAPNGDETAYKAYIKRTVKAKPEDDDADIQTGRYLDVLDAVTRFKENDFSKPERPAEALCEAVFRTIKLIENPSSDGWKGDAMTFRTLDMKMPAVIFDQKTGRFRTIQGGDTPDASLNEFKVKVAAH
jgi:hypothetical protein